MKKILFLLLIGFAFILSSNAQIARGTNFSTTQSVSEQTLSDADTLSVNGDTVLTYTVYVNKDYPVFYDIQIELDSLGGTPDYDIDLKGRIFDNDAWADLETDVTWDGTTSDTTVTFQEHSTAEFYRTIQLQVNGQAGTGKAKADKISFKVWQ